MFSVLSVSIDSILQNFQLFGIKLGLDRSRRLLAKLGHPQQQVPIVHVAGSNGKGSVCAYLSSVLTTSGYRVGRYTSPHLVHWNERICLNGQAIATTDLEQVLQQVCAAIDFQEEPPTQFEVITAAAWLYFAQQQVDVAVVEVGLGGRLDATNVCDRALVSIIVSISLEHQRQLGHTLGQIAAEKAGILKPYCPAVIGQLPPAAMTVVQQRIQDLACPAVYPILAQPIAPPPDWPDIAQPWVAAQGIRYPLALSGEIQQHNSALAIAALQLLQAQGWQKITPPAIVAGMANTQWQGRLQWVVWQGQQILLDGAHNPASALVLRQFVDRLDIASRHWVVGMMATKDHAEVFQALLRPGDSLFLVPVPDSSSAHPQQLATLAQQICPQLAHCQVYSDLAIGLAAATQVGSLTILTGSLYLLGQFFSRYPGTQESHHFKRSQL